jgi:malate dehydrogenase (quinone)
MLEVMKKAYPKEFKTWETSLKKMIPSYGTELNRDSKLAQSNLAQTAKILKLRA